MTSSNAVHIRPIAAVLTAVGLVASASAAAGQGQTTRQGEPPNITAGGQTNWTSHNLDLDNSRYSELGEVNTETVGGLAERWSYEVAAGTDVSEVTPLVVDGVMYFHAGASVIAVNAVTGAEVWTLELDEARRNRVRGPTYAEGKIYSYNGPNLVAADAKTGELVESFGDGGVLPVVGWRCRPSIRTRIRRHWIRTRSATASPPRRPTTTGRCTRAPRSRKATSRAAW